MTFRELHEILDDEDKKLSLKELQQVIYELKQDCFNLSYQRLAQYSEKEIDKETYVNDRGFYIGEENAFQIVLDLLEHLE